MNLLCKGCHHRSPLLFSTPSNLYGFIAKPRTNLALGNVPDRRRKFNVKSCIGQGEGENKKQTERRSFLTLEEAGLVEISGLSSHEKFLCRLTVRFYKIIIEFHLKRDFFFFFSFYLFIFIKYAPR